ncbi:MAG: Cof-type HAD-IIB family hydrolase [Spirochaetales bacterium]|uniref:Cof-type HAD-IIB family hydrolase n=1 Tax=Candidatus Thalassospirochaeta sargassi TaxID=3119039 RepID=A0AAJ1IFE7_9SPIO|nr:Cof-type HAD-IIB family hydrolase [Spirochaetales bacterium]
MPKLKLIACDMDGTLLDSNKKIPKANIEAVRKLKEQGVYFVIATGRHDSMIKSYLDDLQIEMPVISCNGALVREPFHNKMFSSTPITKDQMLTIVEICREYGADYHIYAHETIFGEHATNKMKYYLDKNDSLPEREKVKLLISEDYKDFILGTEEEFYKILVLTQIPEVLKKVDDEIYSKTGIKSAQSDFNLTDVMQKGITKAGALKELSEKLGVEQEETAAIGDQSNDLDMIKWAGTGVAMANAIPAVKEAAQIVTDKSNGEGGVAEAIEKLLK